MTILKGWDTDQRYADDNRMLSYWDGTVKLSDIASIESQFLSFHRLFWMSLCEIVWHRDFLEQFRSDSFFALWICRVLAQLFMFSSIKRSQSEFSLSACQHVWCAPRLPLRPPFQVIYEVSHLEPPSTSITTVPPSPGLASAWALKLGLGSVRIHKCTGVLYLQTHRAYDP